VSAAQIAADYRACLPLAAWNYTVRMECQRLPREGLRHVEHPKALPADPAAELVAWGASRGTPRPLDQCYAEQLERLEATAPEEWPRWVTGKAVLKLFLERFPVESGPRPASGPLINLYMNQHSNPPVEHMALVRRILQR
jgi:hypothetical protein